MAQSANRLPRSSRFANPGGTSGRVWGVLMDVSNDVELLERLLAARTPALLRTAFLLTGDREAARDLLQSALERVSSRLSSIREPQALEAYLRATMATTAS